VRTPRPRSSALLSLLAAASVITALTVIPGATGAPSGGTVTTVAGKYGRSWGFSGDGGPGTKAQLSGVVGLAADGKGNLYVADTGFSSSHIRKVSPSGIISTVGGGGTPGPSGAIGDGGPATRAAVYASSIAVDRDGNVYIVDAGSRIRKISPDGIIRTIAGSTAGQVAGDGGPATAATLNTPVDLAVDAKGNLYFIDGAGQEVRKVSPDGIITRFAGLVPGTGRPDFSGDGGPAIKAPLNQALALAVDAKGNVYIGDTGHLRIRKVSLNGVITTFAGIGTDVTNRGDGGRAIKAEIDPYDLAFDRQGNLYVSSGAAVRRIDTRGIITTVAGGCESACVHRAGTGGQSPDGFQATRTFFPEFRYLAVDGQGNLYLSGQFEVRKVFAPLFPATAVRKTPVTKPAKRKTVPVSTSTTAKSAARTFELDLAQLAAGRKTLTKTLSGVLTCTLTSAAAQTQITSVLGNRQHALVQLRALAAPTAQTARIKTLLGSALTHSIAADMHYRSWIGYLKTQPRCSTTRSAEYAAAQHEDALATSAKQQFVRAFNPLAHQLGLRTWSANQF
jgi:hypothetical protein